MLSLFVPDETAFCVSIVKILSMQDFVVPGLLCVYVDMSGVNPDEKSVLVFTVNIFAKQVDVIISLVCQLYAFIE